MLLSSLPLSDSPTHTPKTTAVFQKRIALPRSSLSLEEKMEMQPQEKGDKEENEEPQQHQ